MAYLTFAQIQELQTAAVNTGLIFRNRMLLFRDIRPSFVGFLQFDPAPLNQFTLDINALNNVDKLEDGTVPLALYLRNSADQIKDLPEARIFQKYENLVVNRSGGVTRIAPLTALPAAVLAKEAIVHQDDTVDAAFIEGCAAASRSVAKLVVPRFDSGVQKMLNGGPWLFNGTGWLLKPDVLITNHHVINARADGEADAAAADFDRQAERAKVVFDYDVENGITVEIGIARVEASDPGLDYCILRLADAVRRNGLALSAEVVVIDATSYMPLNIIQHPHGKAKRFALRNNLAVDADQDVVRYYTDTDSGSSGSPVMNDRWKVVALHRGAILKPAKFQGKDTAFVNVGSQITRVAQHVKQQNLALGNELGF